MEKNKLLFVIISILSITGLSVILLYPVFKLDNPVPKNSNQVAFVHSVARAQDYFKENYGRYISNRQELERELGDISFLLKKYPFEIYYDKESFEKKYSNIKLDFEVGMTPERYGIVTVSHIGNEIWIVSARSDLSYRVDRQVIRNNRGCS